MRLKQDKQNNTLSKKIDFSFQKHDHATGDQISHRRAHARAVKRDATADIPAS
jgi:hypothetical protein